MSKDIEEFDWKGGCLDMVRETLASCGCCHGHDNRSTPPMMYPEWIKCVIAHYADLERETCALMVEHMINRSFDGLRIATAIRDRGKE